MNVIHISVPVIINAISVNLTGIGPDGIFKLLVIDINAGVDDGNNDGAFALCLVIKLPCRLNVNINSCDSTDHCGFIVSRAGLYPAGI